MEQNVKELIWQQMGAAIDSIGKAIDHCPDEHWQDDTEYYQIWYMSFHTIFWLDYYLSSADKDSYSPPTPFTMSEMDPSGIIPDPAYTKEQLKTYLAYSRNKAKETIMNLTDEQGAIMCPVGRIEIKFEELLLYIMRHVQHHAAQMNLLMRQKADTAPSWTFRAG